jgi:hypothetical protein
MEEYIKTISLLKKIKHTQNNEYFPRYFGRDE